VSVTAVNDAPVLANASAASYTENAPALLINTLIAVSDVDSATLASASVAITNFVAGQDVLSFTNDGLTMGNIAASFNSGTGVLSLSSATASATLAQWQSALRAVSYANSSDNPSTVTRNVTFTVNDGAAGSNSIASTVSVTAVNDAPAVANVSAVSYTENDPALPINNLLTVSDVDNPTLASASVAMTNFVAGQDVLSFANDGTTMGNIAASFNSGTGVLSLSSATASATLAQWQSALRAVSYANSSDNPSTATRNVTYSVNDGAAGSNSITSTIGVTAVNDAPVLANASAASYTQNAAAVAVNNTLTVSDVDSGTLAGGTVTVANFVAGQDALSFANDGATMGNIAASFNGGTGVLGLSSAGATATLAQWQSALRAVSYANSSSNPDTATRNVTFAVNDGGAISNSIASTVSVTALNNAPTSTNATGAAAVPVAQNAAAVVSATDFGGAAYSQSVPANRLSLAASPAPSPQNSLAPLTDVLADHDLARSGNAASIDDFLSASLPEPLAPLHTSGPLGAVERSFLRYGLREFVVAVGTEQGSELTLLRTSGRQAAPMLLLEEYLGSSRSSPLIEAMDQMREGIENQAKVEHLVSAAAVAAGVSLSVGYLVWLVRGGILLSSLLSALPAWRMLDPLPVLARVGDDEDDEDVDTASPRAEAFR
jgi:hypothetical protein